MIRATVSAASHTGHVRERNEDYYAASGLAVPGADGDVASGQFVGAGCVAIVADGLGGHAAGDFASRLAVESFVASGPENPSALVDALHGANKALYAAMSAQEGTDGMGATVAAVLVTQTGLAVANVGDTKAFEIVDDGLQQLTIDDVPRRTEQLPGLPSSTVTQTLGGQREATDIQPHLAVDQLGPDRRILICSDGLTDYVPRPEIREVLGRRKGPDVVEELMTLALEAGGQDNITLVLIEAEHAGR